MSTPISEASLEKLRESSKTVAEEFGKLYGLMACKAIYDRARTKAEKQEEENMKLQYREFDSVRRIDLFMGYVDVKKGKGPGSMKSWQRVFLVEKDDYGLEFYASEQAFRNGEPKKKSIQMAGYEVVTQRVAAKFRDFITPIANKLGEDASKIVKENDFPHNCWALFHPHRTKYVFRKCEPIKWSLRMCCSKNKPDNSSGTNEEGVSREQCIYHMKACVRKAHPRNTDTVLGAAFDEACNRIPSKVDDLKDWKDDGTEDEMLLEMLMTACVPPLEDTIIEELKSASIPVSKIPGIPSIPGLDSVNVGTVMTKVAGRFLIPVWYKTLGVIKKAIQAVLKVTWKTITKLVQKMIDKTEGIIQKGLAPIVKIHNKILDTVKGIARKTLGQLMAKYVTPHIESVMKAFAEPLSDGFAYIRDVFWAEVTTVGLPQEPDVRNQFLDLIPRRRETMKFIYERAFELADSLDKIKKPIDSVAETLKSISGGSSDDGGEQQNRGNDDDEMDEDTLELCTNAEDSMLRGLDAIIFTLRSRLENGETMSDELKESILTKEFDSDVIILKRDVVKDGTRTFLMKYIKMGIFASNDLNQGLDSVDGNIPSDMQDFVSVRGIFEGFLDLTLGEAIDEMVEKAFPLRGKKIT